MGKFYLRVKYVMEKTMTVTEKIDGADASITFTRPNLLPRYFKECVISNSDYPYGITTDKTYGITDKTIGTLTSPYEVVIWEIRYYVLNSLDDWKKLCKNTDYQNIITSYVDFATQTILGFVFQPTTPIWISGCRSIIINMLKILDNTIFARWGEFADIVICHAIIKSDLPFYDAIATGRKLSPSSVIMKYGFEDFCPYNP